MATWCCSSPSVQTPESGVCASCGSQLPANELHMACSPVPQVSFEDFIPDVAVHVPGAPEEVIGHMIRRTVINLALRTGILRRVAWLDGAPDVFDYDLRFGDCYNIGLITSVEAGGVCLRAVSDLPCGDRCDTTGDWFRFEHPSTLYVGKPPGGSDNPRQWIEVNTSVIPSQGSCKVDRLVYDRYLEVVVNGALARLFAIPGEPWSNGNLAVMHHNAWVVGVRDTAIDRYRGSSEQQVRRKSMMKPDMRFLP